MHGSKTIIDLGFADRLCKIIFMLVEFCSTKYCHDKKRIHMEREPSFGSTEHLIENEKFGQVCQLV